MFIVGVVRGNIIYFVIVGMIMIVILLYIVIDVVFIFIDMVKGMNV